jgi:outer membrane translocation and assembly module TamA
MLQLEEAPPRNIGIGVGFGSEEGPRLSTRWMHRNWLGMGWKDRVEFKISALELGFKNTLDIPHYFSEDGHLQNILEYGLKTEDEYDVWVGLVDLNWSTPVADDASLTAGWQIKSEEHDVEDSVLLALNNPNESALLTGPHFSWSQQGQRSRTQWSATSKTELYADVSKGESSLWKQTFTVNASRPFIKEWQVLSRMKLGWADGFDRGQLPVMERFYSGGSKSVRGFARREIGARTNDGFQLGGRGLSEFSIELQHPLFIEELIGALFCDAGQVASQVDAFNFGDLRYGVGFGFGFALPMGLMKLDFGFPLERESWESAFQIHFDFGVSI